MLLPFLLSLACTSPDPERGVPADPQIDTSADSGPAASDPERVFVFALIADPHVTGPGEHADRVARVAAALDALPTDRSPELVFVLGDIAWGGGWSDALSALETMPAPWVPIIGDNPIQVGEEIVFDETFGAHLEGMASHLEAWVRAALPVDNPERGGESWLQNSRFDHKGVRFVGLDWNSREMGTGWGEMPDLHDFAGGTLPFLVSSLETLPDGPEDRVVMLSHMPLVPGLTLDEQADFLAAIAPYEGAIWGQHAGHLHGNGEATWEDAGFEIRTTDATWDDVNTYRLVEVWSDGVSFTYVEELIEVPDE